MGNAKDEEGIKTNEEYREKIISIFSHMDSESKLRFWYKYISAIENGED